MHCFHLRICCLIRYILYLLFLQISENMPYSTTFVSYLETQYFLNPEAALISEENKQASDANVSIYSDSCRAQG